MRFKYSGTMVLKKIKTYSYCCILNLIVNYLLPNLSWMTSSSGKTDSKSVRCSLCGDIWGLSVFNSIEACTRAQNGMKSKSNIWQIHSQQRAWTFESMPEWQRGSEGLVGSPLPGAKDGISSSAKRKPGERPTRKYFKCKSKVTMLQLDIPVAAAIYDRSNLYLSWCN